MADSYKERLWCEGYEELGVISVQKVRDSRLADERAKRGGVHVEKNGTQNGALWYSTRKRGSCR